MRLGQIKQQNTMTAAVFEGTMVRPVPGYTVAALIQKAEKEGFGLTALVAELASRHPEEAAPVIPLCPTEVWACGCTYETSAAFRDGEVGTREGMYAHVYREARPEIFFKGTSRVCVGPGRPIGIRPDSRFTAPEPELALILGSKGKILGYTLANDVSAWDIERENPLYLPQSKVYTASCALGPVIVTVDELVDPYGLEMSCTITRGDRVIFSGGVSTARLHRKFDYLVDYLLRANPVPAGSVLLTGTGIIIGEEAALAAGDRVSIRVEEIGELSNLVAVMS
jgi:2-dehydro-3-deoxy-D-arabinonate dehydratase